MIRLSRPCYDKPHRCPGWAGGGAYFPKKDTKYPDCDNGSIRYLAPDWYVIKAYRIPFTRHSRLFSWHLQFWWFGRCKTCDVVTWPYVIRWLDPGWWKWVLYRWTYRWDDWKYERQWRKENP